jgi:NitT/TauT family transport system substrate-binding protein
MFKKFVQQDQDRLQLTEVGSARRDFLVRSACMAGCAALGGAYLPQAMAAGPLTLKATHGTGLCNCPFFLVKERNLAQGVSLDFVTTPSNADIAALFGAGVVDVSVVPYTNFMTLYDAGAPIKIVAGSGVQGCVIVAQPGITSAAHRRDVPHRAVRDAGAEGAAGRGAAFERRRCIRRELHRLRAGGAQQTSS